MPGLKPANLALQEVGNRGEATHHEVIEEDRRGNGIDFITSIL